VKRARNRTTDVIPPKLRTVLDEDDAAVLRNVADAIGCPAESLVRSLLHEAARSVEVKVETHDGRHLAAGNPLLARFPDAEESGPRTAGFFVFAQFRCKADFRGKHFRERHGAASTGGGKA